MLGELTRCSTQLERAGEVEAFCRQLLAIREARLERQDVQVACTLHDMARCLALPDRAWKAASLFRQALVDREVRLRTEHVQVAYTVHDMVRCLTQPGGGGGGFVPASSGDEGGDVADGGCNRVFHEMRFYMKMRFQKAVRCVKKTRQKNHPWLSGTIFGEGKEVSVVWAIVVFVDCSVRRLLRLSSISASGVEFNCLENGDRRTACSVWLGWPMICPRALDLEADARIAIFSSALLTSLS
ncbi:unnamed protein product [Sphacelaria rigidula]